MTTKKRMGLCVPIGLYEILKEKAEYTGQTLNALILQILWDYVEEEK